MKAIIFVSKEQWSNLKKKKIKAGDLMLHNNVGKKADWVEGAYPPVKVEIVLKEVK